MLQQGRRDRTGAGRNSISIRGKKRGARDVSLAAGYGNGRLQHGEH